MCIEYDEYVEPVTYIQLGESSVTKANLVKHLSHYHEYGKFEAVRTGSLNDNIGKMLAHHDIVTPWTKQQTEPGEMASFSGGTRVGWKDNEGRAAALYRELTVEQHTYRIRLAGQLKDRADTERDAQHAKAILERRNPDVCVEIETVTNRVIDDE